MSSRIDDAPTPRQASAIAGFAYVGIIVLALFANFFVLERLTDPDDAATTVSNIANYELLFRSGVAAFIIVFILDVVVAWGLYVFLRRTSSALSLFAAWFRVVYAAIAGVALLNLLIAARLVGQSGYTTTFGASERNAQVMLFLDAYTYGWSIALVCFGVHLLLLGLLIVKSDYVPSVLGILVVVAGLGYVVGKLASVLLPDYNDAFLALIAVMAVPGEFGLTGWLLWRGARDRPAADQPEEIPTVASAA
jgi:Domain of unknown function (DUF4386)